MGVTDVLSRKSGVIVGDDVLALFKYAREHKFAMPAIVRTNNTCNKLTSGVLLLIILFSSNRLSL